MTFKDEIKATLVASTENVLRLERNELADHDLFPFEREERAWKREKYAQWKIRGFLPCDSM